MSYPPRTFMLGRASAALAIFAALLGSTAPSPLYPVYIDQMHLSHAMSTAVFAIYAIGTLFALGLTMRIGGRFEDLRRLIVPGLVITAAGALVFATAGGLISLLIGRFLNGFGTGIVTGMASVVLYDLSPRSQKAMAATISTLAFTGGAAGGPLLSSAALVLQLAPTLFPFLVIVAIVLLAVVGLLISDWPEVRERSSNKREQVTRDDAQVTNWPQFSLGCVGVGVAWFLGSTLMAVGTDLGIHIYQLRDASLAGLIPALFQLFGGIGQVASGRMHPTKAIGIGLGGMAILQMLMDLTALTSHGIFVLALICVLGFVYGASFVGALGLASQAAAPERREDLISRFYIIGYLCNAVPSMLMGVLIDQAGLQVAFWIFSAVFVVVALCGLGFALVLWQKASDQGASGRGA